MAKLVKIKKDQKLKLTGGELVIATEDWNSKDGGILGVKGNINGKIWYTYILPKKHIA